MTREIKFRAWDTNPLNENRMSPTTWTPQELMAAALRTNCALGNDILFLQFTGLKDKNGVEIYEGDILVFRKVIKTLHYQDTKTGKHVTKHRNNPKEELHYWEVFFTPKGIWRARRNENEQPLHGMTENHEIIGNIYQNPELLK